MKRLMFFSALIALLSGFVALLLTFQRSTFASFVLSIAVIAECVVVIALVLQLYVPLPGVLKETAEAPASSDDKERTGPDPVLADTEAKSLFSNKDQAENMPSPVLENDLSALTTLVDRLQEPDIGTEDVVKEQSGPRGSGRDDLLENTHWLKLVTECIALEGDLADLRKHLDQASQPILDHTILRIQELLVRSDVEMIAHEQIFDRTRHKTEPTYLLPLSGTPVIATLHPGFAVGRRVLRRAQVQVSHTLQLDSQNAQTGE